MPSARAPRPSAEQHEDDRLRPARDVEPGVRLRAIRCLADEIGRRDGGEDARLLARQIEAAAHALAATREHYRDHLQRCLRNCHNNPGNARADMATARDADLVHGTLLARIRSHESARRERFHAMLHDKFESIRATPADLGTSSLRCRRCNSDDISWELKQTRSSDEASTAFCVCATCHNRWTMH